MKSDTQRSIERARAGQRGASTSRGVTTRPHLEAVCPRREDGQRLPLISSLGTAGSRDFGWVSRPRGSSHGPLQVFANEDDVVPRFTVTPRPGDEGVWEVIGHDGQNVATVFNEGSRWRSKWAINTPEVVNHYRLIESKGDALWRRSIGRLTRIDNPALDWLGLVLFVFLLPAMLKSPVRMSITDHSGADTGFVAFPSTSLKPRESFSIYLNREPYPMTDTPLALGVLAIMEAMS